MNINHPELVNECLNNIHNIIKDIYSKDINDIITNNYLHNVIKMHYVLYSLKTNIKSGLLDYEFNKDLFSNIEVLIFSLENTFDLYQIINENHKVTFYSLINNINYLLEVNKDNKKQFLQIDSEIR